MVEVGIDQSFTTCLGVAIAILVFLCAFNTTLSIRTVTDHVGTGRCWTQSTTCTAVLGIRGSVAFTAVADTDFIDAVACLPAWVTLLDGTTTAGTFYGKDVGETHDGTAVVADAAVGGVGEVVDAISVAAFGAVGRASRVVRAGGGAAKEGGIECTDREDAEEEEEMGVLHIHEGGGEGGPMVGC
jgi:hypothetical protein